METYICESGHEKTDCPICEGSEHVQLVKELGYCLTCSQESKDGIIIKDHSIAGDKLTVNLIAFGTPIEVNSIIDDTDLWVWLSISGKSYDINLWTEEKGEERICLYECLANQRDSHKLIFTRKIKI